MTRQHDPNLHQWKDQELNEMIESLCISKAEEFRMLGYEHVTGQDIWNCVSGRYTEGKTPQLHEIVNDILSLKVVQFMNYMMVRAYTLDDI